MAEQKNINNFTRVSIYLYMYVPVYIIYINEVKATSDKFLMLLVTISCFTKVAFS